MSDHDHFGGNEQGSQDDFLDLETQQALTNSMLNIGPGGSSAPINLTGSGSLNGNTTISSNIASGPSSSLYDGPTAAFAHAPVAEKDRVVSKAVKQRLPQIKESTAMAQLAAVREEQKRRYEATIMKREKEELVSKTDRHGEGSGFGSGGDDGKNEKSSGKRARSESGGEGGEQGFQSNKERQKKQAKFKHEGNLLGTTDFPMNATAGPSTFTSNPAPRTSTSAQPTSSLNYPNPRIFLTRTAGRLDPPLSRNTITLGQILDKSTLRSCFLFSFFIGQDELFSYLPLKKSGPSSSRSADIIIGRDLNMEAHLAEACVAVGIHRANPEGKKAFTAAQHDGLTEYLQALYKREYGRNFNAVYTNMVGKTGCVHSKFGMVVYEGFLRVFITSGNLMALDTVHGDNHWFIVDLPELPKKRSASTFPPDFEQELFEHASLLGCPKEYINSLFGRYDYSAVSSCHIVASIPGNHSGENALQYGALRLRECVRPYMRTKKEPLMEICTGSIGGMQEAWLRGIYHCFSGAIYDDKDKNGSPPLKIFYPTRKDVEAVRAVSREGASQIGSHFKYAEATGSVRDMFYHYKSKDEAPDEDDFDEGSGGQGCLFHQKLYMCFKDNFQDDDPPLWFCVGSHNLSKAAWGDVKDDLRKKKGPRVKRLANIANYELSVVMPGSMIKSMLEPGSDWQDIVPHQRNTASYSGSDKPFNSAAWVSGGGGGEFF